MTPGQAGGTAGPAARWHRIRRLESLLLSLRETLFGRPDPAPSTRWAPSDSTPGASEPRPALPTGCSWTRTKLTAALNADAGQVASLLDGSTGPLSAVLDETQDSRGSDQQEVLHPGAHDRIGGEISRASARGSRSPGDDRQLPDDDRSAVRAMEATLASCSPSRRRSRPRSGYSTILHVFGRQRSQQLVHAAPSSEPVRSRNSCTWLGSERVPVPARRPRARHSLRCLRACPCRRRGPSGDLGGDRKATNGQADPSGADT
jgi:hypothetical protein